jgi:hypothetical protein
VLVALLAVVVWRGLVTIWPLALVPPVVYQLAPAGDFLQALRGMMASAAPGSDFIFQFRIYGLQYLASEAFKNQHNNKFLAISDDYIFKELTNINPIIKQQNNVYIISDTLYDNLFLGKRKLEIDSDLNIYNNDWFNKNGNVIYYGLHIGFNWDMSRDWVTLEITRPLALRGRPARLKVRLDLSRGDPEGCALTTWAAFHRGGAPEWSPPMDGLDVELDVPDDLMDDDVFRTTIKMDTPSGLPSFVGRCVFRMTEARLEEAVGGLGPEEGDRVL